MIANKEVAMDSPHQTTSTRKTLHIFSNADQHYFDGLAMAFLSALHSSSGLFSYHFHVLDGGINNNSRAKLQRLITELALDKKTSAELTFHQIDFTNLSHLPLWCGSHMTYTKMLIPELLPTEDVALYVDSDTLLNKGIEEVFTAQKPHDTLISGVRDFHHNLGREHPAGVLLTPSEAQSPYINAGVMWLNLKGLREIKILDSAAQIIQSHPNIHRGDQTLFNYICRNHIHLLPKSNNLCLSLGTGMQVAKEWRSTNLHYIGEKKPWLNQPSTTQFFAQKLWHSKTLEFKFYTEPKPEFPNTPSDLNSIKRKYWTNILNPKRARRYRQDISSVLEPIG